MKWLAISLGCVAILFAKLRPTAPLFFATLVLIDLHPQDAPSEDT